MKRGRLKSDVSAFAHTQKTPLLRAVHIGDELLGFGIRVMQETLAKFGNRVVTTFFAREWLVDESVFGEFVAQPPRNLLFRGSDVVPMHMTQTEPDRLRCDNDARLIQQIEDVAISSRHPRDWRWHLT